MARFHKSSKTANELNTLQQNMKPVKRLLQEKRRQDYTTNLIIIIALCVIPHIGCGLLFLATLLFKNIHK